MIYYIRKRNKGTKKKTTQEQIETILKLLPLLSGYVIFLGTATQMVYYHEFKIKILEFISLSEALLFGLQYVYLILIFIVVEGLMPLLLPFEMFNLFGAPKNRHHPAFQVIFWVILSFLVMYVSSLILRIVGHQDKTPSWLYGGAVIITIFLSTLVFKYFNTNQAILAFFFLLTASILSLSYGDAIKLKDHPEKPSKVFTFKTFKISASDSLIYVGKVEKFFFFYNNKLKSPEVYSADEITSIK